MYEIRLNTLALKSKLLIAIQDLAIAFWKIKALELVVCNPQLCVKIFMFDVQRLCPNPVRTEMSLDYDFMY